MDADLLSDRKVCVPLRSSASYALSHSVGERANPSPPSSKARILRWKSAPYPPVPDALGRSHVSMTLNPASVLALAM
jgi:hypothetical protein